MSVSMTLQSTSDIPASESGSRGLKERKAPARKARGGMMQRIRGVFCSESGQNVVELGLLLPLIIFVVVATLELARVYVVQQHLTSAARTGARTGSVRNSTVAQVRSALDTYLSSTEVGSNYSATIDGVSPTADFNTTVTVTVNYELRLFVTVAIPGLDGVTVPLSASVTMRHQ